MFVIKNIHWTISWRTQIYQSCSQEEKKIDAVIAFQAPDTQKKGRTPAGCNRTLFITILIMS